MIPPRAARSVWPRLDALLLAALIIARVRIDTLAEGLAVPLHVNDVAGIRCSGPSCQAKLLRCWPSRAWPTRSACWRLSLHWAACCCI